METDLLSGKLWCSWVGFITLWRRWSYNRRLLLESRKGLQIYLPFDILLETTNDNNISAVLHLSLCVRYLLGRTLCDNSLVPGRLQPRLAPRPNTTVCTFPTSIYPSVTSSHNPQTSSSRSDSDASSTLRVRTLYFNFPNISCLNGY
jgi:hypothetical protein